MLHADQIALYVLAAFILGGIAFFMWVLAHLLFEARHQPEAQAQFVEHHRLRR